METNNVTQLKDFLQSLSKKDLIDFQKNCKYAVNQCPQSDWRVATAPSSETILLSEDIEKTAIKVIEHWMNSSVLFTHGYNKYLTNKNHNIILKYEAYSLLNDLR